MIDELRSDLLGKLSSSLVASTLISLESSLAHFEIQKGQPNARLQLTVIALHRTIKK